jgi:hypothetical protein
MQYLRTFKSPTVILARFIMKIQDLDYEFEYLKGKQNEACDFLSRFPENTLSERRSNKFLFSETEKPRTPSEAEENEINAINTKSKHKCKKNKVKDKVKENRDNYLVLH